jgi:endothelin-converting enzyme
MIASRSRLEKILMAIALALLILASTFIGLFAGAEHQVSKERGKAHPTVTTTVTATHSVTRTSSGEHGHPTGKPDEVDRMLWGD